jgi:hypothetical protein
MAEQWRAPSWTQLHRMGQLRLEVEAGLHNPHYTVRAERVRPQLDWHRLADAWQRVQAAHPVLGSRFDLAAGLWSVPEEGSTAQPPLLTDTESFTAALVRPFDYRSGPVARLVIADETGESLVGLAIEHLVSDGWTLSTVWHDLVSAYAGAPVARETGFVGYVADQHRMLQQPETELRVERVRDTLAAVGGAIPALALPAPDPAAGIASALVKGEFRQSVPQATWQDVAEAARRNRLSAPNILLAAFHAALAGLTGQPAVGSTLTLANRLRAGDRGAAGWYAGKLTVPADTTDADTDPARYLRGWQQGLWQALDSSDIPWAYLLHRFNPDQFGRFTAIPFATFNFQPETMHAGQPTRWPEADSITPVPVGTGSRDAALATFWLERDTGVEVLWEHRVDVLPPARVAELWSCFSQALDQLRRAGCPPGDPVTGQAAR